MTLYLLDALHDTGKVTPLYRRQDRAFLETTALRLSDKAANDPDYAIDFAGVSAFTVRDQDERLVFSCIIRREAHSLIEDGPMAGWCEIHQTWEETE